MAAVNVVNMVSGGQQIGWAVASVDLPSMNTVTSGTVDITLTGLVIGDLVLVFPTTALTSGVSVDAACAIVSVADTVTVRATNSTAGTVNPAAQVMRFEVFRNNVPL